ncbi:hypothetical protein G2W53_029493 [Senna tora]|uniref:Uncharacterized protein n=1 Tax=Senna tora TaxID=362788 RepID=A0A834WFT2_9FABA|nr:hypothetical protein G2W53_029493 [Senna tora]
MIKNKRKADSSSISENNARRKSRLSSSSNRITRNNLINQNLIGKKKYRDVRNDGLGENKAQDRRRLQKVKEQKLTVAPPDDWLPREDSGAGTEDASDAVRVTRSTNIGETKDEGYEEELLDYEEEEEKAPNSVVTKVNGETAKKYVFGNPDPDVCVLNCLILCLFAMAY